MLTLVKLRLKGSWFPALFHILLAGTMILLPWRETDLPGFSGWLAPFLVFIFTPGLLQTLSAREQKDFGHPPLALALPVSRTGYLAYLVLVPVIILILTLVFAIGLSMVFSIPVFSPWGLIFTLVPDHLGFVLSGWLVMLGIYLLLEVFCSPAFRMIAYVFMSVLPFLGMFSPLGTWLLQEWQQVPLVDILWFPDPGCLAFALVSLAVVHVFQGRSGPVRKKFREIHVSP